MRMSTVLRMLLGLCRATVITGWTLDRSGHRLTLVVWVRCRADTPGRCGRCGQRASGYDQGDGPGGGVTSILASAAVISKAPHLE